MTGSKVGQFLHNMLHLRSNSSGSSSAKADNSAAAAADTAGHGESHSSGGHVPKEAAGADCSINMSGSVPPADSPLIVDVQNTNGTTTSRRPLHQQTSNEATESHSAPLPDPAAAADAGAEAAPHTPSPLTPATATAAAAAPAEDVGTPAAARSSSSSTGGSGHVTWSPGQRSTSLIDKPGGTAAAAGGSSNTGRSAGLSRRSMGALSLSYSMGGDGFKVRVGICAMDKKATSKPMREIVNRLEGYGEFELVSFGDDLILNHPISDWPKVDCLMSWYSDGFPLKKAQAYADATRPFLINDLHMQDSLQDRRAVYKVLQENGILVPTHIVVSREGLSPGEDPPGFIEEEDYVELNGVRIDKPFVEKPASGEDHNIHIYYPHSMGGGVKRLFRKIDNKSSCYDPHHPGTVRRDGSFIYEEFLATGGTDVKVYTVGPRYAHAEARKSPVVDGRVLRTADGKEMRFPVLLNPAEKEISRTVCLAFGQKVCGFDLLRSEKGRSYVCDVNGWSFVKNSRKYYDDAAGILRSTILAALAPHRLALAPPSGSPLSLTLGLSPMAQQSMAAAAGGDAAAAAAVAAAAASVGYDEESLGLMRKTASFQELSTLMAELSGVDLMEATRTDERSTREELRCVLAVIRHGDRTPKQKLKVRVRQPALLSLFSRHADAKGKQAKLKSPVQLQELLDICRSLLQELEHPPPAGLSEEDVEAREEQREKLTIVKTVLEQGGQFSGINRKVQLKPLAWSTPASPAAGTGGGSSGGAADGSAPQQQPAATAAAATAPGADDTKQQPPPQQQAELQEVLLILKYGGVLTHAGRAQAEELGKVFRLVMYPRYGSTGGGLLRLHSTYRHDLKIYSSDEGRVQVSAAAFTKGLLALEGSSLTPILVSLVTKDASMLDAFGKGASDDIRRAKQILYTAMTWDPNTATSNNLTPAYSRSTTPAPTPLLTSPPLSPRSMSRASSSGGGAAAAASASGSGSAGGSNLNPAKVSTSGGGSSGETLVATAAAVAASCADAAAAAASGDGSAGTGNTGGSVPAAAAAVSGVQAQASVGPANGGVADISGMPDNPLQHLKRLNELMVVYVEELRKLVLAEKRHGLTTTASSSAKDLTQASAAAPVAATAAAAGPEKSSSSTLPAASSCIPATADTSSSSGLLTSMTSMTNPPPAAVTTAAATSPQRPSTAPPGGAAAGSGGSSSGPAKSGRYSSLSQDPQDWVLEADRPCSGERLLLMFDRWQKLAKSFCKKGRYDISKVPDIYDSAKYDALHNGHLGLRGVLDELYREAKILADAVIPNEYGVDPAGKLAIGSKIATELLAKLLDDLRASKDESLATLTDAERCGLNPSPVGGERFGGSSNPGNPDAPLGRKSMPALRYNTRDPSAAAAAAAGQAADGSGGSTAARTGSSSDKEGADAAAGVIRAASAGAALSAAADHAGGGEAEVEGLVSGEGEDFDAEPELIHRLCPMYASDINSPLRHVRTRIYFTSESHMHSLVNLLRFCHLRSSLLGSSSSSNVQPADGGSSSSNAARSSIDVAHSLDAASAEGGAAAAAAAAVAAAGSRPSSSSSSSNPFAAASTAGAPPGLAPAAAHLSSNSSPTPAPLLSEEAHQLLSDTTELDYLTHLVFRLYENMTVTADHPERFRIEILFCPGTAYDPTQVIPPKGNHTLPPRPRVDLHRGDGGTLANFEKLLRPFAAKRKAMQQQTGSSGLGGSGSKGV